jgi:uncharacterized repeat protein (TIGR02543 family)
MRASSATATLGIAMLALSAFFAAAKPLAVVIVDLTPPSITFISPDNNSTVSARQTVNIQVRFDDSSSGLSDVYVNVLDSNQQVVARYAKENLGGVGSHTATLSWTPSTQGTFRIAAGAHDVVGNYPSAKSINITVGAAPTCTLTISVNNSAWGTTSPAPGTHPYTQGEQVTVVATPSPGYRFSSWSGNASGTSASITVTMDENKSIIANFEVAPQTCTLSVSVSPPGSGTVVDESGAAVTTRTVNSGTTVLLTARPSAGYEFVGWSGESASGTSTTVLVTVTKNTSVTANFREAQAPTGTFLINGQAVAAFSTLSLPTTSLNFAFIPSQSAESITAVTVTVNENRVPLTKWGTQWAGSYNLPGEGTYSISVSLTWAGKEVPVCIVYVSYQSLATANPPGKVNVAVSASPPGGGAVVGNYGMVDKGTIVVLTAYPNEGYRFVAWRGDGVSGAYPQITLVANNDMNVQAVFELAPEEQWKQETKKFLSQYLSIGLAVLGAILMGLSFVFRARGR